MEHMKNIIFENFRGKNFSDFFSDDQKKITKCSKNLKNTKNTIFEISKVLKFWIEIFEIFDLLSSLSSEKKIENHTIFLKLFLRIQKLMNFQKSIWFTLAKIFQYIEKSI